MEKVIVVLLVLILMSMGNRSSGSSGQVADSSPKPVTPRRQTKAERRLIATILCIVIVICLFLAVRFSIRYW